MARVPKPRFKEIESLTHDEARRRNIPTAEMQSLYEREAAAAPKTIHYPRATPLAPGTTRERNPDLDPQLVWRGKDEQDWSDLVVHAPPLYIQEKVHPKVIIEDLRRQTQRRRDEADAAPDLFADFNGLPDAEAKLEFYQHDQNWSNRMILGDSLQVMASLAEREGLRGQVQCIYIDPPYGIRFNSNWQVSTRSRDVKDGQRDHISREPEQIKAFRDTWRYGIHSYLTYLRDRFQVARDLLHESGSIFVQIGDDKVHVIRELLDEIFGEANFVCQIPFVTTSGFSSGALDNVYNYICWYGKDASALKFRPFFQSRELREGGGWAHRQAQLEDGTRARIGVDEVRKFISEGRQIQPYTLGSLLSQGATSTGSSDFEFEGRLFMCPPNAHWKTTALGMIRLAKANRVEASKTKCPIRSVS
jgi:adenine-specific DNA-methyltransferase